MQREQALAVLRAHRAALESFGVASLSLFGSVARDEAGPASDVDLLVEFSRPVGLFEFAGLQEFLSDTLGRPVDLVTANGLKRQLRERIVREAVRAA